MTNTDMPKLADVMETVFATKISGERFGTLMVGIELALAAPDFWTRILKGTEIATEHQVVTEQNCAAIQELYDKES